MKENPTFSKSTFITFCLLILLTSIEAEAESRVIYWDIKSMTKEYQEHYLKRENDHTTICEHIEDYQNYIDQAIAVVTNELFNNSKLLNKLIDSPITENREAILGKEQDIELKKFVDFLVDNGIKIGRTFDGGVYPYQDPMYIVKNFKGILPEDIIEFYIILNTDNEEGYEADSVLTIPWDKLREKIIRYENYLKKYSSKKCYFINREAKKRIKEYFNSYLFGTNNSPIDDRSGSLNAEAKKSYEKFLAQNKDSKYYKIIYYYYNKLKKFDFDYEKFGLDQKTYEYLKEINTYY